MAHTGRFLRRARRRPPEHRRVGASSCRGARTRVTPCPAACPAHHMRAACARKYSRPLPGQYGCLPTPREHAHRLIPLRAAGALTLPCVLSRRACAAIHRLARYFARRRACCHATRRSGGANGTRWQPLEAWQATPAAERWAGARSVHVLTAVQPQHAEVAPQHAVVAAAGQMVASGAHGAWSQCL